MPGSVNRFARVEAKKTRGERQIGRCTLLNSTVNSSIVHPRDCPPYSVIQHLVSGSRCDFLRVPTHLRPTICRDRGMRSRRKRAPTMEAVCYSEGYIQREHRLRPSLSSGGFVFDRRRTSLLEPGKLSAKPSWTSEFAGRAA